MAADPYASQLFGFNTNGTGDIEGKLADCCTMLWVSQGSNPYRKKLRLTSNRFGAVIDETYFEQMMDQTFGQVL